VVDDQVFAAHLAAGRAAWPAIVVSEADFRAHLARHAPEAPADAEAARELNAADLYLACACAAGDRAAIAAFEQRYFGEIVGAALRSRLGSGASEEMQAQLRELFFVGGEEGKPMIAGFSGRGDLRGWVRVTATRLVARVVKRERREVRVTDDSFLDALAPSGDPELAFLKGLYQQQFTAAFKAAVAATNAREKSLLRFSLLEGLSVDEIGKLHNVHRATAARWIAAARDGVIARLREGLKATMNVETEEMTSLLRLMASRLGMSLEQALKKGR
jgi:RNA polymerase sigma-70 factor (ECF subfamily)